MSKMKEADTTCEKCGAQMPPVPKIDRFDSVFTVTGYRCEKCGHYNDLKSRKKNKSKDSHD